MTEKANILLVDDQRGKLLTYEALLRDLGENLLMASSAAEALQLLLKHEVAVILIDVCMPELDGFELARMIRDHPRFSKTAIIFVSAIHLAETDHLRGYDAGAVDYLPVPLVPELLRAKVRVFVDLYKKTKQLETLNAELERRVAERTAALELTNSRLRKSERGRRLSLAAGNMGSWEFDAQEDSWHCDEGLSWILGVDHEAGNNCLSAVAFYDHEEWRSFSSAFNELTPSSATFQREMCIRRRDGESRICLVAAAASFLPAGGLERIDGVMVDITDRKEVERIQKLLAREVDHRARNALAIVQAIMRLSKADTLQDYAEKVERRVHALAHTHELLSNARWQGADICHLVRDELAPYEEGRTAIEGPSVILPPEKAQSVALTLHELATNAAKYGALSSPEGCVDVNWVFEDYALTLDWIERGGPEVVLPTRSGFGTRIIHASLDRARGDWAEFDWRPDGLHCQLHIRCGTASTENASAVVPYNGPHTPSTGPKRILVVEDEALVAMLTCDYLDALGYNVVGPYGDMDTAREAISNESFDLALLDVSLAGKPIYPLARLLRSLGYPFVLVTGFSADSIDSEFSTAELISKPIDQQVLADTLARVFGVVGLDLKRTA